MAENFPDVTLRTRKIVYELLDTGNTSGWMSRLVDWFLIGLIAINVTAVILETVPSVQAEYGETLYGLEIFSVAVFTIEYFLRCWSCVENPIYRGRPPRIARLKYTFTPMAIIDLIAIAPFYLAVLFNIDLRFLRVLRLLRIFKLTRYSEAMTTLLKVLREEMSSFAAAIFIMLVIMIVAASGIYLVEHDNQPDQFGSIPQAMWWAIVTLTTVGYGDVTPLTMAGKIFAACIMVAGVGLVALPTGILASGFSDNLHRGRAKMTRELHDALADGVIDAEERANLDKVRKELGLTEERFEEIMQSILEYRAQADEIKIQICPHCGERVHFGQSAKK